MNTYEIIKNLSMQRKISIAELERTLNLSNGSISKWAKNSPNAKYLEKIADYFDVSVDYLLGRTEKQTESRQQTINEAIETAMANDGKELDQHDKDVIKSLIEAYLDNKK